MNTRPLILDLGRCLRASTPPMLTLGALILARTANDESPMSAPLDGIFLVAWRAAMIGTLLWFLSAALWAVARPLRDRRAFDRLHHLREMGAAPDRTLVHVQTTVWSSTAGQHASVVSIATGAPSRVWLPEATVPVGAFVVLERTSGGVRVVDWMNAHHVEAGQRHERRDAAQHITSGELGGDQAANIARHDARQLIEETELFLREQEFRW